MSDRNVFRSGLCGKKLVTGLASFMREGNLWRSQSVLYARRKPVTVTVKAICEKETRDTHSQCYMQEENLWRSYGPSYMWEENLWWIRSFCERKLASVNLCDQAGTATARLMSENCETMAIQVCCEDNYHFYVGKLLCWQLWWRQSYLCDQAV